MPRDAAASMSMTSLSGRVRELVSLVRLRPFDVSTEAGRIQERHRRVILSGLASVLSKGLGILTILVTTPFALELLGKERYGLWMTIGSIASVMAFADFGLGSGLLTSLSNALGRGDRERARELVSSAFFPLLGLSAGLLIALAIIYPIVPWPRLFNVSSAEGIREAGPAAAAFLACNIVLLPLSITTQVRGAHQAGFAQSFWSAIGNLLGLIAVLIAIQLRASLPVLVLALTGAPILAATCSLFRLLRAEYPDLAPRLSLATRSSMRTLFATGALFVGLELSFLMIQASDSFIIAQLFGAADVTEYWVVSRLFGFAPMVLSLLTMPLWPAYGEAIARGDRTWVNRTLLRSTLVALLVVCGASAFFLIAGETVIRLWTGTRLSPSMSLMLGWAGWALLSGVGNAFAMYLNAAAFVRFQVICLSIVAVTALALKLWLGQRLGLAGIIWGTVIAYAAFSLIPTLVFVRREMSR